VKENRPKRIGIFGGTFNPLHKAHLKIAERAKRQFHLDTIYFVPVNLPPHKYMNPSVTPKHRLAMIKLAIREANGFKTSDIELKRLGVSYTVDTLMHFKRSYPRREFYLIIGADNLVQFSSWRSQKKILQNSTLVVYKRKGYNSALKNRNIDYKLIKGSAMEVSSTKIRRMIGQNRKIARYVPEIVVNYIKKHLLFKRPEKIM
jgi:nicotinate-nucleotide adenylyltransferase